MTWRARLLWLAGAACLLLPVLPPPPLRTGAYVQDVTPTSAVVARIEPAPRSLALEVRERGGGVVASLGPSPSRRRHAFAVAGLRPGRAHDYRLLDAAGEPVDAGSFRTAPDSPDASVRFAVVGDSGGLPWWVWLQETPLLYLPARHDWLPLRADLAAVAGRMAAAAPDLWFHVGDVVYPRGRHRHYRAGFFRAFARLLRQAPCYPVLGNHDVMHDRGRPLLQNFHLPRNELTGDERFWSFAWGPARFVGLDLNHPVGADDVALRFLERALEGAREPWRVVFTHFPYHSASRQRDRGDLVEHLLPALARLGVDVVFAGHDHNYQRFGDPAAARREDRVVLVITGGGGKSLYDLRFDPRLARAHKGYQFCSVALDAQSLELRVIGRDGQLVDVFTIDEE